MISLIREILELANLAASLMFFLDKTSFQDKQLKELIPMKDDMNEELVNDEARELMRQKRELGCPKLGSLIF